MLSVGEPAGGASQAGPAVHGNKPSFAAPISLFEPEPLYCHSIIFFLAKIQFITTTKYLYNTPSH